MEQELKGKELMRTALIMLMGVEGVDWCYYTGDFKWWELRLYTRIN